MSLTKSNITWVFIKSCCKGDKVFKAIPVSTFHSCLKLFQSFTNFEHLPFPSSLTSQEKLDLCFHLSWIKIWATMTQIYPAVIALWTHYLDTEWSDDSISLGDYNFLSDYYKHQ